MTILVTGATGTIGSLVLQGLAQRGASVRALVREAGKAALPAGASEVVADMADVAAMRQALTGVRSLFLLNAVTPAEVTQGLQTLALARDAGIERIVYLSVIHADQFTDVPHFTGKYTVERMIEQLDLPVTVLRPAYFMQNERQVQAVIQGYGVYPMPIGSAGVAMIDTRDIADVAVAELLRRDAADSALPRLTMDLGGPELFTGESAAQVWGRVLGREIRYGGDDLQAFEAQLAQYGPGWMAYDMRLMMNRIQQHGMKPAAGTAQRLEALIGHPLRTYEALVQELAAAAA